MRRIESPAMVLTTADRTLCLAWNVSEPYWLATGGRDRTIRVNFYIIHINQWKFIFQGLECSRWKCTTRTFI